MDMDELLQRIDKARLEALDFARTMTAEAEAATSETEQLARQIAADGSLSVARAMDTILGLNTPKGKLLD